MQAVLSTVQFSTYRTVFGTGSFGLVCHLSWAWPDAVHVLSILCLFHALMYLCECAKDVVESSLCPVSCLVFVRSVCLSV